MYFWKNDKLYLRRISEEDNEIFYAYFKDTNSRKQAEHGIGLPASVQISVDMAEYAVDVTNEQSELWFAIMSNDDEMVGYAVIDWMNINAGNAQININMFEEYKRQGYATSAANILLKYLFEDKRYYKIGCCVLEGNEAGKHFADSIGMKLDGFRSEIYYTGGKYIGEYYYSMLADEYDAGNNNPENQSVPDSNIGDLMSGTMQEGMLVKQPENPGSPRKYFWEYDGIELCDMTEEYYVKMNEIAYDSEACVKYDGGVKLPAQVDELSEQQRAHLNFEGDDNRIEYAILDEEKQFAGCIAVCGIDKKNGKFSYSIYITKETRGKGIATKALRLIVWYYFNEMRMNKMICCANEDNPESANVMRKIGCKVEGIMRANEFYHGKYIDVVMFGVTKDEFNKFNGFC